MRPNSVRTMLHCQLTEFMTKLGKWDETLLNELPASWENYNGFLIFQLPTFQNPKWRDQGVWEIVCSCLKGHSIAIRGKITNDSFRSPSAELVYGSSPVIHYLDNGIRYTWNVDKTMFCAGNVTERHRVASFDCRNEIIVDLFAGIGYFTLPYIIHAKAEFVHACEWNPFAVEALRKNLQLNNVEDKCMIYEGDNRELCPKKVANRVNLGLIPSSEGFWEIACGALLETGGILYVHNNVTSKVSTEDGCEECNKILASLTVNLNNGIELPVFHFTNKATMYFDFYLGADTVKWKYSEWFLFSLHISHVLLSCFKKLYPLPWEVYIENVFRVKSYAPHIDHLVYTAVCKPIS